MAVGDAHAFPGFLTPVLTQLFFPKPRLLFSCFCRGERRKYTGKKSRLNRGSNSQPPGLESDTLTTEPPGRGFHQDKHSNFHDNQTENVDSREYTSRKFSKRKNFEVGLLCSYVPSCDPRGGTNTGPRGIILTNLVEVHKEMLHTKNQSFAPSSFRDEEF